ncbi:methyl-accepting chemotaxis protein [Maritalea sp.]|uniref:methyl-accepting chemotaxis protein n=1 Tax=Maritalea sp. TaxID=2003361 RepID=UPI003EFA460F
MIGNWLKQNFGNSGAASDAEMIVAGISRSQAVIEFDLSGTIITANENFLSVLGYELDEIVGQHHSLFIDPEYAKGVEYADFWKRLSAGEFFSDEFMRIAKGGKEVWIQATYNPVLDADGKPVKVVKFASDITEQKQKTADARGQIEAIGRSQAVIEFDLDGTILDANQNFLDTLGYSLKDIVGRHHRIFVDPSIVNSDDYKHFWAKLGRGEYDAGQYERFGKRGQSVWIQASYNPIFDDSGRPVKIVKYATDITARRRAISLIGETLEYMAQGDLSHKIEEKLDGELDEIRQALNQTIEQFSTIVTKLQQTSRALRGATGEILAGANDLSDRTAKEAAAVEETSAAIEEMSTAVTETRQRASEASETTRQVAADATSVGEVMDRANNAMEGIATSATEISNIIGLIDNIAFQTNLLALNASVEAARAGEAGKGFAVVAVEVRRLAQSAAESSSEIKALIEKSTEEVVNGTELVADASSQVGSMVERISQSSSLVEEISVAMSQQADTILEVGQAVRQIDEMAQQNAALVEETNAAIEQCETQTVELDNVVDEFKLSPAGQTLRSNNSLAA